MPSFEDWTRVTWWELHTLACFFPEKPTEEKRKSFAKFLESFAEQLPCTECGAHMKQHMKDFPVFLATESRAKLQEWMYKFQEAVNKRRGKPQMHTLEQVQEAFKPNLPWKSFGGFPIQETMAVQRAAAAAVSSLTAVGTGGGKQSLLFGSQGNKQAPDGWVWILIIGILCILLLVAIVVGFVLWRRYASLKNGLSQMQTDRYGRYNMSSSKKWK